MFQAITIPSKLLEYASLLVQIKKIKKYSVHSCSEKSAHTDETYLQNNQFYSKPN